LISIKGDSQSSSNNIWTPSKYLGYNASNGVNPLEFRTNNIFRLRLNGNTNAIINGVLKNVNGFVGIAPNGWFAANTPVTMLHLYGPNNTLFGIGGGYRSWMSSGMLVNENSDAIYVGMKSAGCR
jgi:hypothetical protein